MFYNSPFGVEHYYNPHWDLIATVHKAGVTSCETITVSNCEYRPWHSIFYTSGFITGSLRSEMGYVDGRAKFRAKFLVSETSPARFSIQLVAGV